MSSTNPALERLCIDTIRTLAMDAVEKAKSGHPGTPMALAPVAYSLWNDILRYDPSNPQWPARDRFILSCGHASMLLYSLLHLAGVRRIDTAGQVTSESAVTLDDIRRFRQWQSPCAGHPEHGAAAGIETTTGPLGQGVGNSVGMALAAQWIAARYNRPGFELFGFRVYAMCSDGDVMEGVGCEAASLAGHLRLPNLCWIYDDNHITIEGSTNLAFSEDVARRFEGLGWRAIRIEDANDLDALRQAWQAVQETQDRPTIICVRSIIAYGAPHKANTSGAHGSPLGEEEVRLTKEAYGWPTDEPFRVPPEVPQHFAAGLGRRGKAAREAWRGQYQAYQRAHPDAAAELELIWSGRLPEGWSRSLPSFEADAKGMATRTASGKVLNALAPRIPWLVGGSADLAPSTMTHVGGDQGTDFSRDNRGGRNLHFGVREHAMAAAANGMALCGLRPYAGTFFIFSDYLRPSMRLSSMMRLPVLYVFTHDSIGLGEDGPTHQPIEQLAACRAIPGLTVVRPADANEVTEAYRVAMSAESPMALVLTRQNLPTLDRTRFASASGLARGAYVLADPSSGLPEVILMGTGSEVSLCVAAYEQLTHEGCRVRLVSMPSWELFEAQDADYRDSVLSPDVTCRVAIEAGVRQGWDRYLGPAGRFIGLDHFGASAPYAELYREFGLTADHIVAEVRELLG